VNNPALGEISLIKVKIQTWRMHQIRVHTASIWFPVLWDIDYGKAVVNRLLAKNMWVKRQLLHSYEYSFFDVFSQKKISITAPMPDDFKSVINYR
jgi:23S rRNA-/tRNA-specific pseudouridylate synthase